MHCINTSHPEFKVLKKQSGLSNAVLSTKVSTWMQENSNENFPTLEELNIKVQAVENNIDFAIPSYDNPISNPSKEKARILTYVNALNGFIRPESKMIADKEIVKYNGKYGADVLFMNKTVNGYFTIAINKNAKPYPKTISPVTSQQSNIKNEQPIDNNPIQYTSNGFYYNGVTYKTEEEAEIAKQINESDDLIPSGSVPIENAENVRLRKINQALIKQQQLLSNSKTVEEQKEYLTNIEELVKLKEVAEQRSIIAGHINAYEDVVQFAEKQLLEIENMLTKSAILTDDVNYIDRITNLWIKAGDFSSTADTHIFLDEYEFNTPEIREIFRGLANRAQDIKNKLVNIEKEHVTKFVQQYTGKKVTSEDIYKHLVDVGSVTAQTLNISRHGDPMLQAIFNATEYATMEAQREAVDVWDNLDELTKKFLKKTGNSYEILKQKTLDGKETGRTVHRFSPEFFETRNRLLNQAFRTKDPKTGKVKKDPKQIKAYFDWVKNNTTAFDIRILFEDTQVVENLIPDEFLYKETTYTQEQKEKHIVELKAILGEKGYEYYIERAQKKIEKFQLRRATKYEKIQLEPGLSQEEKDALFVDWNREYSPYWSLDMIENPFNRLKGKDSYYSPKGLREYVEQVPNRKTQDGKLTQWYDKNFEKIEADEDLLAYHTYMMDLLNKLRYVLPDHKKKLMGVGVIPTVEKSLMDMFNQKGLMMGIVPFWDKMKELQTTTDFATTVYSDIDPITGKIEKNIQYQFIEDTDSRVIALVKEKSIEHRQKTGKTATAEDRAIFRAEAKDYLSKQKSWDLTKILKAYSLVVLGAKHKSFIEPQMKMLERAFKNRKEVVTNKAGGIQQTPDGKTVTKDGLENLTSALDFFMDSTFYGVGGRKVEGVTKTKLYTKEEQTQKDKLEALLEKEEDLESKAFLQKQIDALGGFRTISGVGDTVLKYMTLKGLGWNISSAMSNIGFGTIANVIEGSSGLNYSSKSLRNAYLLTSNSIGKNWSLGTAFNSPDGVANKIRTLMDNWDILQTSNKEMFDTSQKSSFDKLKRFGPYSLQERSEYLNQAPIMIAVLMEAKAQDSEGKEISLWEALDSKGNLKEGFTTEVDMIRLMQKVKRIIEMNHGDYNNALQVKSTITGRLLSQFRTWMFEGFANRFESGVNADGTPKIDYALSYGLDDDYVRKGRYRSYTKGQLLTTATAVGTMALPGIGTAIGAGIGYVAGKFVGLDTKESLIEDTLYTLKQLAKKLMLSSSRSTAFDDKFTKQDAANMRKNMTELYIMLGLMAVGLIIKAVAGDDDEEEVTFTEKQTFAVNVLLNQTMRLQTDIGFYTNPLEAEKLTKTAVPMASLVQDVQRVVTDVAHVFNEDEEDDIFESGPFKGTSKALVHTGQLLPGSSQLIRLYRSGSTVFE
jgi:hypothetical protein